MISTPGKETEYQWGTAKGWKRFMICDSAPCMVSARLSCDGCIFSLQPELDHSMTKGVLVLVVNVAFAHLLYSVGCLKLHS